MKRLPLFFLILLYLSSFTYSTSGYFRLDLDNIIFNESEFPFLFSTQSNYYEARITLYYDVSETTDVFLSFSGMHQRSYNDSITTTISNQANALQNTYISGLPNRYIEHSNKKDSLKYNLVKDEFSTNVLESLEQIMNSDQALSVQLDPNDSVVTLPFYIHLPSQQSGIPGIYTDIIKIFLNKGDVYNPLYSEQLESTQFKIKITVAEMYSYQVQPISGHFLINAYSNIPYELLVKSKNKQITRHNNQINKDPKSQLSSVTLTGNATDASGDSYILNDNSLKMYSLSINKLNSY